MSSSAPPSALGELAVDLVDGKSSGKSVGKSTGKSTGKSIAEIIDLNEKDVEYGQTTTSWIVVKMVIKGVVFCFNHGGKVEAMIDYDNGNHFEVTSCAQQPMGIPHYKGKFYAYFRSQGYSDQVIAISGDGKTSQVESQTSFDRA
jgi:hypothetical protein